MIIKTTRLALWGAIFLCATFIFNSCRQKYTPKPMEYFRIDMPSRSYQQLDTIFPYFFEYANIATIEQRSRKNEPYWINIHYPQFKGTIHMSYKKVENNLENLLEDSRTLVYKHTIKADGITESQFENRDKKVFGILYNIEGNTASSIQFTATDSTNHFLRGALYFMNHPNQDSLAPVIQYIEKDIQHMMETLTWK